MLMRLGVCLALLVVSGFAWAQTGGDVVAPRGPAPLFYDEASSYPPRDKAVNKPTLAALEKPIDKFMLEGVPLDQALEQFKQAVHVNMTIDWKALEDAGVMRRKPLSIQLSQVPAGRVLEVLLGTAAGTSGDPHFLVTDNMVVISTRDDLRSEKYQIVSVYDMRPLFADVDSESEQGQAMAGDFMDTLKSVVDSDSWRDNGGTVGSVRMLNGQLIVNQAIDTQERVAAFVAQFQTKPPTATRMYDVHDLVKEDVAPAVEPAGPNRMDALINAIETTCGRDTWRNQGGKSSSIAAFDGKLYVTAKNAAVHRQVEQLLEMMRKKD